MIEKKHPTHNGSHSLLTDLYQLTMACGYYKNGIADRKAVFYSSFRECPFGGGYAVSSGLETLAEILADYRFTREDLDYLASVSSDSGRPLFEIDFLKYLENIRFECDVDAVPEGSLVFPGEPLVRVRGPLIQCQLVETILLNTINFQTLIATKAARICHAAGSQPVIDFGLRRAQGMDGGISATRAAYIGGCAGTSNVLAGKQFGIPIKGTMAHSWIMAFDDELDSFQAWADAMPESIILLVDTYSTLEGIKNAIVVGKKLKKNRLSLSGIRLDSGDLASLSIKARKMLDENGFSETKIVASGDLDEHAITLLKSSGAKIDIWGVGTKLITAFDQPALDGVYKLSAFSHKDGTWEYKIKKSDQPTKTSIPGVLEVRRYYSETENLCDVILDSSKKHPEPFTVIDPSNPDKKMTLHDKTSYKNLLIPVFRKGRAVYNFPSIIEVQKTAAEELKRFNPTITRLVNPDTYMVGIEKSLFETKNRLIEKVIL